MRQRIINTVLFLLIAANLYSQEAKVIQRMKEFHSAMISMNVESFLDEKLTYGHSNGWIETMNEFIQNMGKKITYHSYREDSVRVVLDKKLGYSRFIATIDATLDGVRKTYRLRVLEVWRKKSGQWVLFARQAVTLI